MRGLTAAFIVIFVTLTEPAAAQHRAPPVPRPAPAWDVAEWINSDRLNLSDLQGRVVVVEFFQLWCPGCNRFSIPLIKKWEQEFAHEIAIDELTVVSIHTVFEGHSYQNERRLRRFLKEKKIKHPVGVDRQAPGGFLPETMQRFGTRGTPEIAIIDKQGVIRFQKFGGFDVRRAEGLLRRLLSETTQSKTAPRKAPS